MKLTQERLKHLVRYEPETGVFYWQVGGRGRRFPPGEAVSSTPHLGYLRIGIDNSRYQAHRLAWLYVHGVWPSGEIDHINGIRHDNRMANLRDVPKAENMQNLIRPRATNKCGVLGVTVVRRAKTMRAYRASIGHQGKHIYLGAFETAEEAHSAYVTAKRQLHPGSTL